MPCMRQSPSDSTGTEGLTAVASDDALDTGSRMCTVVPRPGPALVALNLPVMLLDQVAGDRQSETEAAVTAHRAAVGLPEPIEDVGQELGRDAGAGVLHIDR